LSRYFGLSDYHQERTSLTYSQRKNNPRQQEAVQTIPWPAMSPDINHIEHVWDFIGRKINQRNPQCQIIDELRTAILREWQQFPQERLRRLVRSMARRDFSYTS
jgi:hypothetical protein